MSNVFTRGLSRISTRKKKTRALPVVPEAAEAATEVVDHHEHVKPSLLGRGMDRIRRSIRQSFRRKRSPERLPPAELVSNTSSGSKHDQWQPDEGAVRAGLCSFNVKYLGSVEVFEARGMQVCEGALKMLRNSRRRPVKSVLYVSGDGLRVVDQQSNRGLIVDQTIEKVSFCAPDRNNDKGFAYICRDGTSRRWMCHGFSASKDSGERLSHAVGCAFAICLERKKKRDDDSTPVVTAEKALHPDWGETAAGGSTGTATASSSEDSGVGVHRANPAYQSFRKQISISDRLQDPQSAIVNVVPQRATSGDPSIAKPRPAPNPALFQRQGSLRAPETSTSSAQFRRNLSLRSTSVDAKPNRVPLGQLMHNEPIYEGDEELTDVGSFLPATSSVTAPPTMAHLARTDNSMYPSVSPQMDLSLFGSPASTSTSHNVTSNTSSSNSMVGGSHWSTFDSSGGASAIGAQSKTNNQWSSAHNGAMTSSTSRNKADEWLEDAMRTSVSFNSPLQTAQVTPTATPQGNGWSTSAPEPAKPAVSSHYSLLDGPLVSGPPPSHPPPPLPAKAAVSNGKQYSSPSPSSPSVDVFGQAIQWDAPPPTIPKPIDPFDVQWSRLAISANNPFSSEHSSGREVSI